METKKSRTLENLILNQNYLLLKAQKTVLVALQERLSIKDEFPAEALALEGIINLIEAIQDIAVDHFEYPEHMVFNLSDEMTQKPTLSLNDAREFVTRELDENSPKAI